MEEAALTQAREGIRSPGLIIFFFFFDTPSGFEGRRISMPMIGNNNEPFSSDSQAWGIKRRRSENEQSLHLEIEEKFAPSTWRMSAEPINYNV